MNRWTSIKSVAPQRLIRWVQIALAVWLAVLLVETGTHRFRINGKAAAAIEHYQRLTGTVAESMPTANPQVQQLASSNLFAPPPQQAQPLKSQAILGDAILIDNQWYRQGQTVNGFEIVSIGPDAAVIVRDGQEYRVVPFETEVTYTPPSGPTGTRGAAPGDVPPGRGMRGRGGPGRDERTAPAGGEDYRSRMRQMRDRFENMSPEERHQMYQRFQNASPEEREQMREQFSQ